jgi:hypothetical protein
VLSYPAAIPLSTRSLNHLAGLMVMRSRRAFAARAGRSKPVPAIAEKPHRCQLEPKIGANQPSSNATALPSVRAKTGCQLSPKVTPLRCRPGRSAWPRAGLTHGVGEIRAVFPHPRLHIFVGPDLALSEVLHGCRKLGVAGDLVSPLAADPAEDDTDFVCSEETRSRH